MLALLALAHAGSPAEWRDRVIYQLLTDRFAPSGDASKPCTNLKSYCGGNYAGLESRLDYITGLGATAIWITPVVANYEGGYHGYWTIDIDKINENFGSEQDLQNLISAAHARGVRRAQIEK